MNFSSKLIFLMRITDTSNKQLAIAMNVDPSLISLYRNNKRGVPKNNIQAMSNYFAKKCVTGYQKSALAEVMEQNLISEDIDNNILAEVIGIWLSNSDNLGIDMLFRTVNLKNNKPIISMIDKDYHKYKSDISTSIGTRAYYGKHGKRQAFLHFLEYILSVPLEPLSLYIFSDENADWFFEDSEFLKQVREQFTVIYDREFECKQIIPSITSTNEAFRQICQWIPAYMTGKAESYYYPRLRDNIYCRTLIVVPNVAAISSNSIGRHSPSRVTTLTLDKSVVNACLEEFKDYLDKCRPLINTYQNVDAEETMLNRIISFASKEGAQINVSPILSTLSTPVEIVRGLCSIDTETINRFLNVQKMFEWSLEKNMCTEIFPLMSIEDVLVGESILSISYWGNKREYYTINTYRQHLTRILYLLETYENYNVIVSPKDSTMVSMMLKEELSAILIRNEEPFTVFEITNQQMICACQEYINQNLYKNKSEFTIRKSVIAQIQKLIKECEEVLGIGI